MYSRTLSGSFSIAGGCIWFIAPLVLSAYHFSQAVHYDYFILLAPVLLVVGLVGFYREYSSEYTSAGRIGIWLLGIGILGFIPIASHRTLFLATLPVGVILFGVAVVGALLAEVGTIGIAIDAWRTSVPSKWIAVWLPLALPATAFSNYVGATTLGLFRVGMNYYTGIFGLAWVGLGYFLLRPNKLNHHHENEDVH